MADRSMLEPSAQQPGRVMHVYGPGEQELLIPLRPSEDPTDRCPGCEGWGCKRCHYTGAVKVRLFYRDWRGRPRSEYPTTQRALVRKLRWLARLHRPAEVTMGEHHTVGGVVCSTDPRDPEELARLGEKPRRPWWQWYVLSDVLPESARE